MRTLILGFIAPILRPVSLGQLPAGLETQLGRSFRGGHELSGGQWQKLALGRAMMRPMPLLMVLDEPTAAIDAPTEHALFERYTAASRRIAAANGGITVLVSHRFSTVRMADLIVVLEGGRIAEVGTHDELARAGGMYAELYEMQAGAGRRGATDGDRARRDGPPGGGFAAPGPLVHGLSSRRIGTMPARVDGVDQAGPPVYTDHARRQMSDPDRCVTEEPVERVLSTCDMSRIDAEGNLRLSGEVADGQRLLVVVAKGSRPPRIISLWPTGKRRRV